MKSNKFFKVYYAFNKHFSAIHYILTTFKRKAYSRKTLCETLSIKFKSLLTKKILNLSFSI